MSYRDSLGPTPPLRAFALLVVVGVPLACLAALTAAWLRGTSGHDYAVPSGPPMRVVVCPSAQLDWYADLVDAADDYLELTDCRPHPVTVSDCEDGPEPGTVQVRACTDTLSDWPGGCPDGFQDRVGMRDGRGVAYVGPTASAHHVLGHAGLRLGHTTAATSWMHGCSTCDPTDERWRPGTRASWIRCTP